MSKIEVDTIDKQSGSTLTLGGSGTAVTLGTGATQSGFGRTGTVDWQTAIKTGDFTAVNPAVFAVVSQLTVPIPAILVSDAPIVNVVPHCGSIAFTSILLIK